MNDVIYVLDDPNEFATLTTLLMVLAAAPVKTFSMAFATSNQTQSKSKILQLQTKRRAKAKFCNFKPNAEQKRNDYAVEKICICVS
jgi:hypothetical protein